MIGLDWAFLNGKGAGDAEAGPRAEDGQRQGEEVVLAVADADTGAMRGAPKPGRRADPALRQPLWRLSRAFSSR
eukprot:2323422-Pyramimonas_sp.AAC.1